MSYSGCNRAGGAVGMVGVWIPAEKYALKVGFNRGGPAQ